MGRSRIAPMNSTHRTFNTSGLRAVPERNSEMSQTPDAFARKLEEEAYWCDKGSESADVPDIAQTHFAQIATLFREAAETIRSLETRLRAAESDRDTNWAETIRLGKLCGEYRLRAEKQSARIASLEAELERRD